MKYHLNLEKYSIEKFKKNLKKRDMIPSRVVLKESIDQRFNIIASQGINNLKQLSNELKTKQKIESFSNDTGLSIEYLSILKREANSYLPSPVQLAKIPGINTSIINCLEKIGIKNTKQLYDKVNSEKGLQQISNLTGISLDEFSELASLADLTRLYGVGPVFARIIYDVGITSVEIFAKCTAKEFINIYEESTNKKADFGENEINFSIELAKELINT
ncbi:MAG: DUF4332 domain-containing protein [Gammaproteobacteria bacterium]|nr:MAG: DUF4332 domain-containing protein [Gammaproteobacteria bacterium]